MSNPVYNATVTQRVEVSPGLVILRVVPDELSFSFEAGQYTILGLRRSAPRSDGADAEDGRGESEQMIRRAYSIASSSQAKEYLEFYVSLVPSGELTPRLFRLELKNRLFLGPKSTGLFTLDRVTENRHALLVGTGTGLAPYMSMLRSELACGGPRRFVILHGARYSWDLGYRSELESLDRHCPNMTYLPTVSRPVDDLSWKGLSGYLQDILISGVVEERTGLELRPEVFHVFVCGNPAMIEAAKPRLLERGFVPDRGREGGNLHTEEYW